MFLPTSENRKEAVLKYRFCWKWMKKVEEREIKEEENRIRKWEKEKRCLKQRRINRSAWERMMKAWNQVKKKLWYSWDNQYQTMDYQTRRLLRDVIEGERGLMKEIRVCQRQRVSVGGTVSQPRETKGSCQTVQGRPLPPPSSLLCEWLPLRPLWLSWRPFVVPVAPFVSVHPGDNGRRSREAPAGRLTGTPFGIWWRAGPFVWEDFRQRRRYLWIHEGIR